jgi:hypothetical protein
MVAQPLALRHPESCLTIFGGVPGGVRDSYRRGFWNLLAADDPPVPETRYPQGIHPVDATRLVDLVAPIKGWEDSP